MVGGPRSEDSRPVSHPHRRILRRLERLAPAGIAPIDGFDGGARQASSARQIGLRLDVVRADEAVEHRAAWRHVEHLAHVWRIHVVES